MSDIRLGNILHVVLREMMMYAEAYRLDWSNFDGRKLKHQLKDLEVWAVKTLDSVEFKDFVEGTKFFKRTMEYINQEDKNDDKGTIAKE